MDLHLSTTNLTPPSVMPLREKILREPLCVNNSFCLVADNNTFVISSRLSSRPFHLKDDYGPHRLRCPIWQVLSIEQNSAHALVIICCKRAFANLVVCTPVGKTVCLQVP